MEHFWCLWFLNKDHDLQYQPKIQSLSPFNFCFQWPSNERFLSYLVETLKKFPPYLWLVAQPDLPLKAILFLAISTVRHGITSSLKLSCTVLVTSIDNIWWSGIDRSVEYFRATSNYITYCLRWLIEVNASPSLTASNQEDYDLKFGLLQDVLNVIDMEGR